ELGRDAFEQVVWDWLRQYGRTIMTQFRRMGASMDYRRERFTMDDDYVRAVNRFFVHLYRKGWIDRANRIINWCPFHETALFDLGRDHGLPEPMVIGRDGRMNDDAGELAGLTQEEADGRILDWLRDRGQLERREHYRHTVARCERCKTRIEPLISLQWWCSME